MPFIFILHPKSWDLLLAHYAEHIQIIDITKCPSWNIIINFELALLSFNEITSYKIFVVDYPDIHNGNNDDNGDDNYDDDEL